MGQGLVNGRQWFFLGPLASLSIHHRWPGGSSGACRARGWGHEMVDHEDNPDRPRNSREAQQRGSGDKKTGGHAHGGGYDHRGKYGSTYRKHKSEVPVPEDSREMGGTLVSKNPVFWTSCQGLQLAPSQGLLVLWQALIIHSCIWMNWAF